MDSQYFTTAALLGVLAGIAMALVFAVFVGGALLRLSVRWVEKATPGYWRCCGAVAIALVFGSVVQFVLGTVLAVVVPATAMLLATGPGGVGIVVAAVASFVLSVLMLALSVLLVVPGADGRRMRFAHACAASALASLMGLALYGALVAVMLVAIGGMPGVSR
jgi:hypothetical protein